MLAMGLRARLALFFIAITVIPLTVAVIVLQLQLSQRLDEVTQRELTSAAASSRALVDTYRGRAGDLATDVARTGAARVLADGDGEAAQQLVTRRMRGQDGRAELLVIADAEGEILGSQVSRPQFANGHSESPPSKADLSAALTTGQPLRGAVLEVREVLGGDQERLGWVAAGIWADQTLLDRLPYPGGAAVVAENAVLATSDATVTDDATATLPAPGETARLALADDQATATTVALDSDSDTRLLLWNAAAPSLQLYGPLLGLLIPAVLLAAAVGWVLASGVVAPVERAAQVARAVAAGDLDQRLEPTGGRELADLAEGLNTMSAELQERLAQLEASRNQLRQSLSRLGQTLSSSLDLDRTLAVVVETAIDTLSANRG